VGETIATWEKVRPALAKLTDPKTRELVDFLFLVEMRRVSLGYLDGSIIPMLCRKAGTRQLHGTTLPPGLFENSFLPS
jgi:hypothetical protein